MQFFLLFTIFNEKFTATTKFAPSYEDFLITFFSIFIILKTKLTCYTFFPLKNPISSFSHLKICLYVFSPYFDVIIYIIQLSPTHKKSIVHIILSFIYPCCNNLFLKIIYHVVFQKTYCISDILRKSTCNKFSYFRIH